MQQLDRLDFCILKSLLLNNGVPPGSPALRKSFRSIAKELGVDQGTIRKRMRAFHERRVLRGWYLGVSPSLTGHDVIHAWFNVESDDAKSRIIEKSLSVKEVERVCNYYGPKISIVLFCKKDADSNLVMERFEKQVGPGATIHKQGLIPIPVYRPKETDLLIIESLKRDPWKPYSMVAKEIGVSGRTIRRLAKHLSEDGVIYMLPIIDLKALHGIIPAELVVDYVSPELKATANARIVPYVKEDLVFSDTHGPHGYFALAVTNVSQVEQIARWVRQQKGIARVQADMLQEVLLNRNHYEEQEMPKSEIAEERARPIPRH